LTENEVAVVPWVLAATVPSVREKGILKFWVWKLAQLPGVTANFPSIRRLKLEPSLRPEIVMVISPPGLRVAGLSVMVTAETPAIIKIKNKRTVISAKRTDPRITDTMYDTWLKIIYIYRAGEPGTSREFFKTAEGKE
jgi:hypothetical protein